MWHQKEDPGQLSPQAVCSEEAMPEEAPEAVRRGGLPGHLIPSSSNLNL